MIKTLILISLATIVYGQIIGIGPCPKLNSQNSETPLWNMTKLEGTWYVNQRFYAYFDTGKCVRHSVANIANYGHLIITSTTNITTNATSTFVGLNAYVEKIGITVPARFMVFYPTPPYKQTPTPIPFSIIDSDYISYAVAYVCGDLGVTHTKFAWALTRERIPAQSVLDEIQTVFDSNSIDSTGLLKVDQSC